MKKLLVIISCAAQLALFSTGAIDRAAAEEKSLLGENLSGAPIYIESKSLRGYRERTVYSGSVVARQKDINLYCEELSAYYNKKTRKVTRIVATGEVKVIKNDIEAHCKTLTFDNINRTLLCEGDPVIWRGADMIEGTKLIIQIDEESYTMENPRSVFDPSKAKTDLAEETEPEKSK